MMEEEKLTIHANMEFNMEFNDPKFLLEGIGNGFSMIVDFLKFCRNSLTIKNNSVNETHTKNKNMEVFAHENDVSLNETLKSSFYAIDNAINIYKRFIAKNEIMNQEIYLLSEAQDIISYFIEDENLKESSEDKLLFLINILETQVDFLDKKIDLIENVNEKESLVIEYNKIFEEYSNLFEKQEDIFYENF